MATTRIKIGTKISHTAFGGGIYEGVVENIEKCKVGEKYGKPVSSAVMGDDRFVLSLDNGKWCHGSQVRKIIK